MGTFPESGLTSGARMTSCLGTILIFVSHPVICLYSDRVVFHSEYERRHASFYKPRIKPPKPMSPGEWSTEAKDYPDRTMTMLVEEDTGLLKSFLDNEITPRISNDFEAFGIDDIFEHACDLEKEFVYPKAATNKAGKSMWIVNRPAGAEEYIQVVEVTKCKGEGFSCNLGQTPGQTTVCRQEYHDQKLVALDERGEELLVDTFSFPSCCSCMLLRSLEF